MLRRLRLLPRAVLLRRDRTGAAMHVLILLVGLVLALTLALPVGDVADRCPARGEGYDLCWVQKALAPAILVPLAALFAAQWVASLLLVRLVGRRRRLREVGERRAGAQETREDPPYARDPFLLASTWGVKEGRSERRRFGLGELVSRLRRR